MSSAPSTSNVATNATVPALASLPAAWRARADQLRRWAAAEGAACALEQAAAELEHTLWLAGDTPLTLDEAARESGYSKDHLERLIRDATIPNAGRRNAPRVRRCDLPRKPGTATPSLPAPAGRVQLDRTQIARSVVTSSYEARR